MKFLLIISLLIGVNLAPAAAQQLMFSKNYGWGNGEWANGLVQTSDHGYAITGTSYSLSPDPNRPLGFLLKTDQHGDSLWLKVFSNGILTDARSVKELADGSMVIAGEKYQNGSWDSWLFKADALGNVLWEKTFGGDSSDCFFYVALTPDGGFISTGFTDSFGAGERDMYLVKTDASGNLEWEKTFGGQYFEDAISVKVAQNGDYIMAGGTFSFSSDPNVTDDIYLLRINPQGDTVWTRTYGTNNVDWANDVIETPDGGLVAVGLKNNLDFGYGSGDVYLMKTDAAGNQLWDKSFSISQFRDEATSVLVDNTGGLVISGYTSNVGTGMDAFVVKTDSEGNILWQHLFTNNNAMTSERAEGVVQNHEGDFVFTGYMGHHPTTPWGQKPFLRKLKGNTVLGLDETVQPGNCFLVYPNPATNYVTLQLPAGKAEVIIRDMAGKEVERFTSSGIGNQTIEIASYPAGFYLVQAVSGTDVQSAKLVIER